ncbi:potassium channel protein [Actinoplanes sp. TBRC 11911]|uniref:potassium channel family protein n=1 Tax=Actinoplanes sp. TBRC 11911 TaxID=2729386 RepID=UPI00145DEC3C|nr:NAD-binding protein [Actinoplanes sp. TBRC 11911]NMO52836.1 potassium channel protein [Actinoplanes sp. TBRC 11911]
MNRRRVVLGPSTETSSTIFLVLRRMRAPLIVLIVIFAVSVFGLTLIPGRDAAGHSVRMSVFDAFYFMSYTATTIGYGELPHPFTAAQRMWVMFAIYLTVIGWAYGIGSLLTLVQDRTFRQALALQRFTRTVARLREPFLLMVGFGQTGRLLAERLDLIGRRLVVLDTASGNIDSLDIGAYHADVPALVADVQDPRMLAVAGLEQPWCEGVLALTDDDETNLLVSMTAALVRPELPVVARTVSPAIEHRMLAVGSPVVVNPFDRFGDHVRLALHAPASYRLMSWLMSGPDVELPEPERPPTTGRWVVCGYGRFGRELVEDLREGGLELTVIDPHAREEPGFTLVVGDASDPDVLARAELADAVGFVAGTANDTTNLSLVAAARRINPGLYVTARQNRPDNAPLFAAMEIDWLLVPAEVVTREIYAQLSTPLLWRFLQDMPAQGDEWAARIIDKLFDHCGTRLGTLWKVAFNPQDTPALLHWLNAGEARLGDLINDPYDRSRTLPAVPLLLLRGDDVTLGPDGDVTLAPGDQILFAGEPSARRALLETMTDRTVSEYVLSGRVVPSGWLWQRMTGRRSAAR